MKPMTPNVITHVRQELNQCLHPLNQIILSVTNQWTLDSKQNMLFFHHMLQTRRAWTRDGAGLMKEKVRRESVSQAERREWMKNKDSCSRESKILFCSVLFQRIHFDPVSERVCTSLPVTLSLFILPCSITLLSSSLQSPATNSLPSDLLLFLSFPLFFTFMSQTLFSIRKWLWKWVSSQRSRRKRRRLSEGEKDCTRQVCTAGQSFYYKRDHRTRFGRLFQMTSQTKKWMKRRKESSPEKKRSARRRWWLRYWKRMRIRDSKNKSSTDWRTWRRQEQTSHSINASIFLLLELTSVSCHEKSSYCSTKKFKRLL